MDQGIQRLQWVPISRIIHGPTTSRLPEARWAYFISCFFNAWMWKLQLSTFSLSSLRNKLYIWTNNFLLSKVPPKTWVIYHTPVPRTFQTLGIHNITGGKANCEVTTLRKWLEMNWLLPHTTFDDLCSLFLLLCIETCPMLKLKSITFSSKDA